MPARLKNHEDMGLHTIKIIILILDYKKCFIILASGKEKKVVMIDKPFTPLNIHPRAMTNWYYKFALKTFVVRPKDSKTHKFKYRDKSEIDSFVTQEEEQEIADCRETLVDDIGDLFDANDQSDLETFGTEANIKPTNTSSHEPEETTQPENSDFLAQVKNKDEIKYEPDTKQSTNVTLGSALCPSNLIKENTKLAEKEIKSLETSKNNALKESPGLEVIQSNNSSNTLDEPENIHESSCSDGEQLMMDLPNTSNESITGPASPPMSPPMSPDKILTTDSTKRNGIDTTVKVIPLERFYSSPEAKPKDINVMNKDEDLDSSIEKKFPLPNVTSDLNQPAEVPVRRLLRSRKSDCLEDSSAATKTKAEGKRKSSEDALSISVVTKRCVPCIFVIRNLFECFLFTSHSHCHSIHIILLTYHH